LDPDAVWSGEWGRSRDGCIRWGGYRRREGAVLLSDPAVLFYSVESMYMFYCCLIEQINGDDDDDDDDYDDDYDNEKLYVRF